MEGSMEVRGKDVIYLFDKVLNCGIKIRGINVI